MMDTLPDDRMPEAEVSLRLALYIARNQYATGDVDVAIDGAQVRNLNKIHFPMDKFLRDEGLIAVTRSGDSWQGVYKIADSQSKLKIHSSPGLGDVVATLRNGRRLRVESKKGKLQRSKSSSEYPLLREAIGQLMTVSEVSDIDLLGVAVPHSTKFAELSSRWSSAPLIQRVGIIIICVHRSGLVDGLPAIAEPSNAPESRSRTF